MGCSGSKSTSVDGKDFNKRSKRNNNSDTGSDNDVILSIQHKNTILKNWKILSSDLTGRGIRIFLLIFKNAPEVQSLFSCGHLEGDELMKDPNFIGHASRFMQAVGAVVDNIDNYQQVLSPLLNDLGRKHFRFEGLDSRYFKTFSDAIVTIFAEDLGTKFTALSNESWRLVFHFIMTELQRGYDSAKHDDAIEQARKAEIESRVLDGSETTLTESQRDLSRFDEKSTKLTHKK